MSSGSDRVGARRSPVSGDSAAQAGDLVPALLPLSIVLAVGIARGGATTVAREVGLTDVPAIGYAFWQVTLAGLALMLLTLVIYRGIPGLGRRQVEFCLVNGLFGAAIPHTIMFGSLQFVSAGIMSVVLSTIPILTYLLALLMRLEPFQAIRAAGIGFGFAGALVILLPGLAPAGGATGPDSPWALGLAFLAPLLYSAASIYSTVRRPPGAQSTGLAGGMLLTAGIILLPVALLTDSFHPIWRLAPVDGLILLHAGIATGCFAGYFLTLRLAGPVYFSQSAYVLLASGLVWGMLVHGERHAPETWAGIGLIVVGLTLVTRRRRPAVAPESPAG